MAPENRRWVRLAAAAVLLAGMGLDYARRAGARAVVLERALAAPARFDGLEVRMPLYAVVAVDGPGRFTASKVVRGIVVDGPADDLAPGDTVSVVGRIDGGTGHVRAERVFVHRHRNLKRLLGLVGLAWALVAGARRFRWRDGWLEERWPTS